MHKTFVISILLFVVILVALDQRTFETFHTKSLIVSSEPNPVTGLVRVLPLSALTQKSEVPALPAKELPTELKSLKERILSTEESAEDRQKMMYSLTRMGFAASDALVAIVKSDLPAFRNVSNPHSVGAFEQRLELSLRITALEALDAMLAKRPELGQRISEIAQAQKDPTLRFLAQVSLSGIQNRQPGKLKRTIDAMLSQVGS